MSDSCRVFGDWGTSRLRLFLYRNGKELDRYLGPGISTLTATPLETLSAGIAKWTDSFSLERIVLCGMAGSRNGLFEVPYVDAPTDWPRWRRQCGVLRALNLEIRIAAGLSRISDTGIADVMRGEETQVFGALDQHAALQVGRHFVLLPGTHSKWVIVQDAVIESFTTAITGELFALLSSHSTLLRAGDGTEHSDDAFIEGVTRRHQQPSGLASALFETRSAQLVQGRSQAWGRDFLSGLLIGDEIESALRMHPDIEAISIIGDPALSRRYRQALERRDVAVLEFDGDSSALAGLALLDRG
jgi:2-dehydro-3-deoxygalactonokinase